MKAKSGEGQALRQFVYQDTESYENMAQELSEVLRKSVFVTLGLSVINFVLLLILSSLPYQSSHPEWWIDLSGLTNAVLSFGKGLSSLFFWATLISLGSAVLVLIISRGFKYAVKEYIHVLAAVSPFPPAIAGIATVAILLLLVLIVVLGFVLQVAITILVIVAIFAFLMNMGG